MIAFTSLLWIWRGKQAGRWYFVTVPEEHAGEIKAHALATPRGFGSVEVEAEIKGVRWQTSLFPLNSGGYLLPVKAEIRKRANLTVGQELEVSLDLLV